MEEVNGNVRDVLQTTLNNSQSLSPKLAGMIRRFKAVTTLLMMRRDAAYADLDTYTKRLHNWVDEFDETMRTSIKVAFSEKSAVIKACREELEEELSTLGVLLKESEKLLTGSTNFDATQKKHGKTLITALKMMKTTSRLETGDVGENLSCLSLSTLLHCDNLPELGQLVTKYSSDEMVNVQKEEKPPEKSKPSEKSNLTGQRTESTRTNSNSTTEIDKVEELTVRKVKRSNSGQRSKEKRSSNNQQNQRFIISQLEKGGISKLGTRCSTGETGSKATVSDNGNTEEQKTRRPIIKEAVFKPFNGSPQKSSVGKKRDRYIALNGAPDIKDSMTEAQNCTKIVNSDAASSQGSKTSGKDQISVNDLSWENELTNSDAHTTMSNANETKKSVLKNDSLSVDKTPTSHADIDMKSPELFPMGNGDYQRTSTPKSHLPENIKTEPLTPEEAKIKQEPQTPADVNNNCAFTSQQIAENAVVKRCFSVSSTETWEDDVDVMDKKVDKKAIPKEEFPEIITGKDFSTKSNETLDGTSPQKDVNCNVIDSGIHSSDDLSSAEKSELRNNEEQESSKNVMNGDENFSNGVVESSQKEPVSNELDCSVSSIPLPKSPCPSTTTTSQEIPNSKTLTGSHSSEDSSSEEKNEANKNEVEKSCKSIMNGIDGTSSNNMIESNKKNLVSNDLDISVSKVQSPKSTDLLEKNQETLNSKTLTDSVITRHAREEINRDSVITRHVRAHQSEGKKQFVPPIPAKMLFKAGIEEIMKFPIGVTTNSMGEVLVGDTGNHVVRVYNSEGKYLRDIGKEMYMKRPSAIVVNHKDEVFVKDDVAVFAFKADGTFIRTIAKGKLGHPFGLALTPDGYLDGSRVDSFPFAHLCNPKAPGSSKCRFLAVQAERLIVSDLGTSFIYISDNWGQILFEFGGYGSYNGQFREPSGVTTDQQGNMLIGDSKNDRIQIFKPNGTFLCDIQFDKPIQRPSDIHLTRDGKLYVSNFLLHIVSVYQLGQP
uniref:Tripartite motif-containing protein 2 n=1 Tax=Magallana gigas TaxID=29159 RepID=A0A8W8IIF4_MAGGI